MNEDELFMSRCIQLAKNGKMHTHPNPMVGAVVVHKGRIIGEGYHIRCGGPHAEVNAIRSVKNTELLKESTIYVSLEPCSHYGKTPPCADLIIEKQIPHIVIGCQDPFAKVAGRGIQKLRDAGRDVTVGVLEEECRELNRVFMLFNTHQRPYITLKWAESADGFIDTNRSNGKPVILSSPLSQMFVHKKRAESQSILVGRRTALLDNPSLTARQWYGDNPVRLVIDKNLTLPPSLQLFDGQVPTYVFTSQSKENRNNLFFKTLDFNKDILPQILSYLAELQIQSLLVEGGALTLQSFIDADLWDEAHIEKTNIRIKNGIKAPCLKDCNLMNTQHIDESDIRVYSRIL